MTAPAKRKSVLRKTLTDNLGLKVLALAASVGLFVIVSGSDDETRPITVDVVTLLPPASEQKMLLTQIPQQLEVTLRGSRSVLNAVQRNGLPTVQMDLRGAPAGAYEFARAVELPASTSLVQVVPRAVDLKWAPYASRQVRVRPRVEGEVAPGYSLTRTVVEPAVVDIEGEASEVLQIEHVWTESLDVTDLSASDERRVALDELPRNVTYVDLPWVMVTLQVEAESATRTLRDLELTVVGAANATVRPVRVDIELQGQQRRIQEIPASRIVPFVDVTGVTPDAGAQSVAVGLRGVPEGVSATVQPSEVFVSIPAS